MTEVENEMFTIIDPELYDKNKIDYPDMPQSVLQYFGAEDLVVNSAAQIHDKYRKSHEVQFQKNGFKTNNRRFFSVQTI